MLSLKKQEERRGDFKKGIDIKCEKKKLEDNVLSIRKSKRVESINKRRNLSDDVVEGVYVSGTIVDLPRFVTYLESDDIKRNAMGIRGIRDIVSITDHKLEEEYINKIVSAGIIPRLVLMMTYSSIDIQYDACWTISNILATTDRTIINMVLKENVISIFMDHLLSDSAELRNQSLWGLANIAGEGRYYGEMLLYHGLPGRIILMVDRKLICTVFAAKQMAFCIDNLCRNNIPFDLLQNLLPVLYRLLSTKNPSVLEDVMWAFGHLTDNLDNRDLQVVMMCPSEYGSYSNMLYFLFTNEVYIKSRQAVLRCVCNVASGHNDQTQTLIDAGFIPVFKSLLQDTESTNYTYRDVCWALSNIAAGTESQKDLLISNDIIPLIIQMASTKTYIIIRECIWLFVNLFDKDSDTDLTNHMSRINVSIECGLLSCLYELLESNKCETKDIINILSIIESILVNENELMDYKYLIEDVGFLDILEDLQTHENDTISEKSQYIIDEYFEGEEIEYSKKSFF